MGGVEVHLYHLDGSRGSEWPALRLGRISPSVRWLGGLGEERNLLPVPGVEPCAVPTCTSSAVRDRVVSYVATPAGRAQGSCPLA
jgi:hypothetical protein